MTITEPDQLTREQIVLLCKTNMENIRKNVEKIMMVKKINQTELANRIEKERTHINYILKNKHSNISVKTLVAISAALGTSVSELTKNQ